MSRRRRRWLLPAVVLGLALAAIGGQPALAAPLDGWAVQQYDANLTNVHFANANVGFAVGQRGTIMTTGNGGQTWSLQSSGVDVFLFDVHALSSSIAIAVGEQGTILRTTDGGGTWKPQKSNTAENLHAVDFLDSQKGLAAGTGGTILRTVDGGAKWIPATDAAGLTVINDIDLVSSTHAYAVGNKGGIIRSANGGDLWGPLSWTKRGRGAFPNLFAVSFANSSTGWAVGQHGTILRIENDGSKITQQSSGVSTHLNAVDAAGATGSYAAVAGADGTVLYGKQGGATWSNYSSKVNAAGAKVDLHGVDANTAVTPLAPIYAVGVGGTIVKSGAQYKSFAAQVLPAVTGKQLRAVHFVDADDGWAAGADGTVLRTTNGGQTWQAESDSDLGGHVFNGAANGRVVGADGRVFYKTNTAADWLDQSVDPVKDLYAVRSAFGWWIVGETGAILWSLNGLNFNFVTAGLPVNKKTTTFYDIRFAGNAGWIVGANGTILKSTNSTNVQSNTASWQSQNSTVSYALKGVYFANSSSGFAVGDNGVLRTTNGGATWVATPKPPGAPFEDVHAVNHANATVAGQGGIFKYTADSTEKWTPQLQGYPVTALSFVDANTGWAVGDNGLIVKHVV